MDTANNEMNPSILFRLTGVGVVQTDLRIGHFTRVNESFCEMLGYREAELRGLSYRDITHPDDLACDTESFEALSRGEQHQGASITRCLRKDGSRWHGLFAPMRHRSQDEKR